jgi:transcriptional regulator with XRE-family HTH domain
MSDLLAPEQLHGRARAAGLTLDELARRAKLATSTIVRWKRGETSISLNNYRKLLGVIRAEEQRRERLSRPLSQPGMKRAKTAASDDLRSAAAALTASAVETSV